MPDSAPASARTAAVRATMSGVRRRESNLYCLRPGSSDVLHTLSIMNRNHGGCAQGMGFGAHAVRRRQRILEAGTA